MRAIGDQKWCPKCQSTKNTNEFRRDLKRKDGFSCWCRACANDATRRYREKDPERVREMVRRANACAYQRNKPERRRRYELWLAKRFWSHIAIGDPGQCWPWLGPSFDKDGYGMSSTNRSHRKAYELAYGLIDGGLHVLHKCDNPPCCNPLHLFLGTELENVRDAIRKNRRFSVSAELAQQMRSMFAEGATQLAIAQALKVSPATVSRTLHGRR